MFAVRAASGIGIALGTEHPPAPSEGVLAELAGLAAGTDIDEDADVGSGDPQGVQRRAIPLRQ
ncbi:MAG: hypothetical protein ACT4NY_12915 [Pseudonocardiales bacterium]